MAFTVGSAAAAAVFWASAALVVYAYVVYPLTAWCLSAWLGRAPQAPVLADHELPSVSLLIPAYNEEAVLRARLRSALDMDYPADRLEVVLASDGSTDGTPRIAAEFADRGVRLLDFPQRRGKSATLNAAVPGLAGEIVVLTDANTAFDPPAVRRLVRWFHDPAVGAVCGRLVLTDPSSGRNADSLYWAYENFIKRCEGRLGALLGANGAIYAIRKCLYTPIPPGTIVDDLTIPLLAKLRTGCSIIFDDEAIAREETALSIVGEFHRRARIGAGNFQSLGLLWRLLDPRRGWVAFTFLSHKLVRWVCPLGLIGLLVSSGLLARGPWYRAALVGQLAFYGLALLAPWIPWRHAAVKPLRLASMFTGMNLALLVGFWRWATGTQRVAWRTTARAAGETVRAEP